MNMSGPLHCSGRPVGFLEGGTTMKLRCSGYSRLLGLALIACWAPVVSAQEGPGVCRTVETGLACATYCLDGMPRDPFAAISWKPHSLPEPLSLELTVFKGGFEQGEVAVFDDVSLGGNAKQAAATGKRAAVYRGKDERDLAWKDVALVSQSAPEPAVTLRNLEPNLLYRFRIVSRSDGGCVQSEVATCQPAPCVTDWVEEAPQ